MSRYLLWAALALTLVTLGFSGAMSGWDLGSDPGANGYQRSIFALYFAQSTDELAFVTPDVLARLQHIQQLDTYYPFAYAGMAVVFFAALGLRGLKLAWLGVILAAAAIGADLAENEVANRVLADIGAGADPTERLDAMWGHSWIKWGLIGGYAAVMAIVMWLDKRRILAVFPTLAAVSILASWLTDARPELFNIAYALLIPFMLSFPAAAIVYLRASD